ncbi:MAG TPA: hypothetical protein VJU84_01535 [Pyrinomonadaceae bacterium]|nr:hypothetical protein [Pyrinomonadaceae bacterium]
MKRRTIKLLVAVVTLGVGVAVVTLWILRSRNPIPTPVTFITDYSKVDPSWVYITKNIPWKLPPKEIVEDLVRSMTGRALLWFCIRTDLWQL